jgi:4-hydroxyacetophenone monooxygenase
MTLNTMSREALESVLSHADRRTLAALVTHLAGDAEVVPQDCDRHQLVEIAVPILGPYLDGGKLPPFPTDEVLQAAMELAAGEPVPPAYGPLVREYMNLGATVETEPLLPPPGFSVLIIGGGITGIVAAINFAKLGLDNFVIVEKEAGPGGTWRQNTYPGCRVDTPSILYSYSFEPDFPWPEHFSHQPAILDYVRHVVDKYDLDRRIRYESTVESLLWDDDARMWQIEVRGPGGGVERMTANFVVGALGLLRVPKVPDIEGIDSFTGSSFHSSRWNHDADLTGKRVAVIGSGASANQIVPAIAPYVERLTVFQRSAEWMIQHPYYNRKISGTEKILVRDLPMYSTWYRFRQFWTLGDRAFAMIKIDPEWANVERAVNQASDRFRAQLTEEIERQLEGYPALIEKCLPTYPPFGKRMLIDNGWYEAIKRPNVDLCIDPIQRIDANGVVTGKGLVDVDVIIYATGFWADRVLYPIDVTGRGGVDVRRKLDEAPEAYLGMAIEGCPNLIVTPGPNGVPAHAGNNMFYAECQVGYVIECLRLMFERESPCMEVKPEAVREYVDDIVSRLDGLVWSLPGISNWFQGSRSRVTAILPKPILEFWESNRRPDADAYTWT